MKTQTRLFWMAPVAMALLTANGCGKNSDSSATEDVSASGVAASSVGGALSGSSSGGSLASFMTPKPTLLHSVANALDFLPEAMASAACPTFKTAQGSGCTSGGGTLWLTYGSCSFGSSAATWSGTQSLVMSSGSANCGTFPNPGASNNLIRQFVSAASSTTPSSVTVTSRFGTTATIDDATANLKNFNGDTITAIANRGYGTQVGFNGSGARSTLTLAHRIYTEGFDHSVTGQLAISETASAATRTLSGSVKVYHNKLKVVGTSTFNSVTHTDGCCFPTAGSISTAFAAGSNVQPTTAGTAFVGKSETLTFTGCGTGTLVGTDGSSTDVSLSRCF